MGRKESSFASDPAGSDAVRGLSVLIEFLRKIRYHQQVRAHLPVHLKSPNAINPGETFTVLVISVVAGTRRHVYAVIPSSTFAVAAIPPAG